MYKVFLKYLFSPTPMATSIVVSRFFVMSKGPFCLFIQKRAIYKGRQSVCVHIASHR
jgi:hypothetical protein